MARVVGFTESDAERIAQTVRGYETARTPLPRNSGRYNFIEPKTVILARITGRTGATYSWVEAYYSTPGTLADLSGGRTGTDNAREVSGREDVSTDTYVLLIDENAGDGAQVFWFLAAGNPAATFAVKVEQTGGSQGTASTAASYTYTVRTLPWNGTSGGATLGTGVAVSRPRPIGEMTVQAGSTGYGLAFYDGTTLRLWDAGEVEIVEGCS